MREKIGKSVVAEREPTMDAIDTVEGTRKTVDSPATAKQVKLKLCASDRVLLTLMVFVFAAIVVLTSLPDIPDAYRTGEGLLDAASNGVLLLLSAFLAFKTVSTRCFGRSITLTPAGIEVHLGDRQVLKKSWQDVTRFSPRRLLFEFKDGCRFRFRVHPLPVLCDRPELLSGMRLVLESESMLLNALEEFTNATKQRQISSLNAVVSVALLIVASDLIVYVLDRYMEPGGSARVCIHLTSLGVGAALALKWLESPGKTTDDKYWRVEGKEVDPGPTAK